MPRTKKHVQSAHIDLTGDRLDDREATTMIRRVVERGLLRARFPLERKYRFFLSGKHNSC